MSSTSREMVSVAPHNPLIYPQTLTVPTTPTITAANQILQAGLSEPGAVKSVADWGANGVIQRGYVLRPFAFNQSLIREGQMCFVNRGNPRPASQKDPRGEGQTEDQPYTIVNIAHLNLLLEEGYKRGMELWSAELDNTNPNSRAAELRMYLKFSEETLSAKIESEGERLRNDPLLKYIFYFCKAGILERWNYLGFSRKASAADTQNRGTYSYHALNIVFKGPLQVQNIFGENAGHSSSFFIVLKRKKDPVTGRWGAFAFHPWATSDLRDVFYYRQYQAINGAKEYGVVNALGWALDNMGDAPSIERLRAATGIDVDGTHASEFEATKNLPIVWMCIHPRKNCRYLY